MNKEERALERIAKKNASRGDKSIYITNVTFTQKVSAKNVFFINCTFEDDISIDRCELHHCYVGSDSYSSACVNNSVLFVCTFAYCTFLQFNNANIYNTLFKSCNFSCMCDTDMLRHVSNTSFFQCTNMNTFRQYTLIPKEGSFIGYKKLKGGLIAKLLIPDDAKRTCDFSGNRKCRADHVVVLEIFNTNLDGDPMQHFESGTSINYPDFEYRVGSTVYSENPYEEEHVRAFNDNRWDTCGYGIHFFIDIFDAINY